MFEIRKHVMIHIGTFTRYAQPKSIIYELAYNVRVRVVYISRKCLDWGLDKL
jgi:hypothetical protein